MKKTGVIAAAVVAVGAAVAIVVLATGGGGPADPTPPAPTAPPAQTDELDATDGAPDVNDEATAEADAGSGKQLLGEVIESWPEPEVLDLDPAVPISDEAWDENPCKPLAEMVIGTQPASPEEIDGQFAKARDHHSRNHMVSQLTWTYAGCLALQKNDLAPCYNTPGVTMPQRCEDNLLIYRLATATDAAQCEKDVAGFIEAKRDRLLLRQVCRAATGDAGGCKNFRQPAYRWYCELLLNPDTSGCAAIEDPETRIECPNLAAFVRAARKLPPLPGIEVNPEATMALMARIVTEPDFDCAAWYRAALREQCR